MSVTVAANVSDVPLATLKLVEVPSDKVSDIVFGGQAMKSCETPVVFATEATTLVVPGCREVTTPFVSDVATELFPVLQVKGPTFEVMSVVLLKACAVNCSVWF
jgi:hypothetical protein